MRHLMNPLDFTVEELDQLFVLAGDIEKTGKSMPMPVMAKSLPPVSTSQAPEPV